MNTELRWHTPFYVGKLDNIEELKEAFSAFNSEEYVQPAFRFSKCKSSLHSPQNNELPWDLFIKSIETHLNTFFKSLDPKQGFAIDFKQLWMNVYPKDSFQEVHDHAFNDISWSAVYFLDYPTQSENRGNIVFENKHFSDVKFTNLHAIFNFFDQEKFVPEVETGTFIIFPSWVQHYTLPNSNEKQRITITANMQILANDGQGITNY
jgi:uncharacterized protein (TIGR02466 family)